MKSPQKKGLKPSDPNFVAPDGGWAWIIAFASGFSNLWISTMFEQYGLTFVDEFERLKISNSQTTTIFNINASITALIGLFNGPIYRKYSYRQVALFGSALVAISLFSIIWCKSFWSYCVFYGILYGLAIGITQTANAIALNTYFNRNRSMATGISWGITGIGSIGCPLAINILLTNYGIPGTILLFAGLSCHAIVCSLLLQPVHWHTKYYQEKAINHQTDLPLVPLERNRSNSLPVQQNPFSKFIIDTHPFEYIDTCTKSIYLTTEDSRISKNWINVYQDLFHNLDGKTNFKSEPLLENSPILNNQIEVGLRAKTGWFKNFSQKCVSFFDLALLKDLVFLNIIAGKTMICFAEFNFALLSPIILKEFHFERYQIAAYLSLLGGVDTIFRVLLPFITNKIKWNCRVYFLVGALITTIGRIILIHTRSFSISLVVAAIIGFGKALRIIYMALVIPDYVPLAKLPAALGIYMTMFGICLMALAPLVGIVRDITKSYVITIHLLNIFIYVVTISWIAEYFCRKQKL